MYRIVGKLLSADIDGEGNLHIILRGSDKFWVETSARYLRQLNGEVLKFDVRRWRSGNKRKKMRDRVDEKIPAQSTALS